MPRRTISARSVRFASPAHSASLRIRASIGSVPANARDAIGCLTNERDRMRARLQLPIAGVDGRVLSPHQHPLRRFGQLQDGVCCYRVAGLMSVGRIEVELPNSPDALAV